MNYKEYPVQSNLASIIDCFWTLEVPESNKGQRQRIIPDGLIEMAFILGDDIKRYVSGEDDFVIQPRAFVLGQTTEPFYIEPTGYVETFAIRFYPHALAHFINKPLKALSNVETPVSLLFEKEESCGLEEKIIRAKDVYGRIEVIENFFLDKLDCPIVLDKTVESLINTLLSADYSSMNNSLYDNLAVKKKIERKFEKLIGITPKKLSKIIRFQSALQRLINKQEQSLTEIAFDSKYYDQSHFIKDFKEFTGISPKEFFNNDAMVLSNLFYKKR